MKIKSLLMSAALMSGLCAFAQVNVTTPDVVINEENLGMPIAMPLTLEMPDGSNMTNIQVMFEFPEGLKPALVNVDDDDNIVLDLENAAEEAWFAEAGDDIVQKGKPKVPVVAYSDNVWDKENKCIDEGRWPNYTVVGANLTKTPNEANPMHFMTIYVYAPEKVANAETALKAYVKYTQYDDASLTFGEEDAKLPICKVTYDFIPEEVAVEDINAAKAVSSVKYYNAAGVAADSAFEGVNIVVTKYADGSQSVVKVVK